jgi:predicted transglutaminase-like cysteine proteinase
MLGIGRGHGEPLAGSGFARVLPMGAVDSEPTAAWIAFCKRLPDECRIDLSEPTTIELTPAISELLAATNLRVNTTIRPMTDRQHWGVEDRWDYPEDGVGDCEDFQLLKRKLLAEAGLPRRAMRMTVVIDAEGDGHAVLTVRTDAGDLILDNKRDAVLAWNETGYEFIKREGSDTKAWVALGGEPARTVVASRSVRKAAAGPARR